MKEQTCYNTKKNFLIFIYCITLLSLYNSHTLVSAANESVSITTEETTCKIEKEEIYEFLENIEEYIKVCEIIEIASDVEAITFLDEITIDYSVNITYLGESKKLKIECDEDPFKFIIKNGSEVVFKGFEISQCSFINKEMFIITERSSLRLENMNISIIENDNKYLIQCTDSSLLFENVDFEYNSFNNTLAAIRADDQSNVDIRNSYFNSNVMENGYGIFYFDSRTNIRIEDTTFEKNTSPDMASVIYASTVNITMNKVDVKNNFALNIGGFGFFENSSVEIYDSIFSENAAHLQDGGCLYLYNSILNIKDSYFSENMALYSGGAIFANYTISNITNVDLYENLANVGGAIFSNNGTINITTTSFNSNFASEKAGAIFMSETKFEIYDTEFSENISDEDSSVATIMDLNEEKGLFKKCNFTNNKGEMKGAIALYNVSLNMEECNFTLNEGKMEGVIYMTDETNLKIGFSDFRTNSALNGSVFYIEGNSSMIAEFSTFKDNYAVEFGAVAYVGNIDNTVTFIDCDLIHNIGHRDNSTVYEEIPNSNNIEFYY